MGGRHKSHNTDSVCLKIAPPPAVLSRVSLYACFSPYILHNSSVSHIFLLGLGLASLPFNSFSPVLLERSQLILSNKNL